MWVVSLLVFSSKLGEINSKDLCCTGGTRGQGGVFSTSLVQHPADDAGSPTVLSMGYHVSCLGELLAKRCWDCRCHPWFPLSSCDLQMSVSQRPALKLCKNNSGEGCEGEKKTYPQQETSFCISMFLLCCSSPDVGESREQFEHCLNCENWSLKSGC